MVVPLEAVRVGAEWQCEHRIGACVPDDVGEI